MRFKLQLVLEMNEPEKNDVILDIAIFDKDFTRPERIGLSINEQLVAGFRKFFKRNFCSESPNFGVGGIFWKFSTEKISLPSKIVNFEQQKSLAFYKSPFNIQDKP